VGTIGDLPVWENAMAEHHATRFAHSGMVRRGPARAFARSVIERFDVRSARGLDTAVRSLSGGNMQKLVLGRALLGAGEDAHGGPAHAPVLIVANQPTWGLDIGAVAFVHQQLLDARAQGAAVLLISDDLDEIFALADRIAVMHAGHLTESRASGDWNLAAIGLAMAGSTPAATEVDHAA
jgi:simple sugar transport system ATP-binding protein